MKGLMKQLILAVFTAALVLTGCSNVNQIEQRDGKCVVDVNYENGELTRQINPEQFTDSDFSKFTIVGVSSFGDTYSADVTFTAQASSIILEYAPWNLTLTAYANIGGEDKPVLSGSTSVDLTNGTSPIVFILHADEVATPGEVDLDCKYTTTADTAEITKITAGIYDRLTKTKIKEPVDVTFAGNKFNYTETNILPGNYIFMVTFYNGTKKIGLWSDMLKVAPGNKTERKEADGKEIDIGDVVVKKPNAPENLKAYYVKDSERDGFYNVKLTWDDCSTDEEEFVITVKEYTANDAAGTVYRKFGYEADDSVPADKVECFYSTENYVAGPTGTNYTLAANSEAVMLALPTGKLFDVSIQAKNFAGSSASCSRVASTTSGTDIGIAVADDKKITKTMITYLFPAATITIDGETKVGSYVTYVEWGTAAAGQTFPLLSAADMTDDESHEWQRWVDSTGTEVTDHTTFVDAVYTADFKLKHDVSYTIEDFSEFADGEVSITCGASDVVAGSEVKNTDEVTVTVTGNYDYYQVDVNGSIRCYGPSSTMKFKAGRTVSGRKTICVMARKKGTANSWIGKTITVNFSN